MEKEGVLRKACYTEKEQKESCRAAPAEKNEKAADAHNQKALLKLYHDKWTFITPSFHK
jgi:hypothetical protein